jgi:hypothetical protein
LKWKKEIEYNNKGNRGKLTSINYLQSTKIKNWLIWIDDFRVLLLELPDVEVGDGAANKRKPTEGCNYTIGSGKTIELLN